MPMGFPLEVQHVETKLCFNFLPRASTFPSSVVLVAKFFLSLETDAIRLEISMRMMVFEILRVLKEATRTC